MTGNAVAVTVGGLDGRASFGTLVPGQCIKCYGACGSDTGVSGDAVPVVVTVAGQSSPDVVTMAVQ
jgi:hypothetical protein